MKSICRNMGRKKGRKKGGREGKQNIDRLPLESGALRETCGFEVTKGQRPTVTPTGARRPGLQAVSGRKPLRQMQAQCPAVLHVASNWGGAPLWERRRELAKVLN